MLLTRIRSEAPARRCLPLPAARTLRNALFWLAVVALWALSAPAVLAGEPCASTQLTNQLLECGHCQAVKELLSRPEIHALRFELHRLQPSGVVVQIEADSPEATELAHTIVGEMWGHLDRNPSRLSVRCAERCRRLTAVSIERALTDHGALVILHADRAEEREWLWEDAERTQRIFLTASSR